MNISLENWIRNKLQENEEMHDYAVATDTVMYWIEEYNKLIESKHNETVCCNNKKLNWDKHTIFINDKNGSYKDLIFNFCENCGQTFNIDFD